SVPVKPNDTRAVADGSRFHFREPQKSDASSPVSSPIETEAPAARAKEVPFKSNAPAPAALAISGKAALSRSLTSLLTMAFQPPGVRKVSGWVRYLFNVAFPSADEAVMFNVVLLVRLMLGIIRPY